MTSYLIYIAVLVGIYALFSLGLNLQWGYTGLLNFGHVAFMIVGAYTTVGLNERGLPAIAASIGGMAAAGLLAAMMGLFTLRLRQDYLGIVTIGVAESLRLVAVNETWLTRGTQGIVGFDRPLQNPGFEPNLLVRLGMIALLTLLSIWVARLLLQWLRGLSPRHHRLHWGIGLILGSVGLAVYLATAYALFYFNWVPGYKRAGLLLIVLGVLALVNRGLTYLLASPWGRIVQAIREDETVVTAVGKPVFWYKLQSLILGGAIAGLAGAFYSWHLGSVFPDHFKPQLTFDAWTIVILGGAGHPLGPILGSTLFWSYESLSRFVLPDQWSDANVEAIRLLLVGTGLVLLMRWRPQGILGQ